jgi:polyisoprenoid-binding protein YceI
MQRRLLIAGVAAIAVAALAGGGVYIYFFSGLRTSPAQLGLSATPAATPSATASSTASSSDVSGTWTVTSGSLAGYRVKELFVGESSKHEAVARTSTVSGGLTVSSDSNAYQVSAITITAGLADLHSVDSVAGRNVTQRDSIVSRQLDVQQFPNATFAASAVSVQGGASGQQVTISVPGQLTIHGVTKDVTVSGKAQLTGGKIEVAGSLSANMSDFGVSPPLAPFVTVDNQLTLEFDIFLART